MPELPEVETLRLQLSSLIIGKTIKSIDILKTKSFTGDKKLVFGKKIIGVRRFAKILVIDLTHGLSLAIHLKMSGQLIYKIKDQISPVRNATPARSDAASSGEQSVAGGNIKDTNKKSKINTPLLNLPNRHTRVVITFTDKAKLFFNDQRMFGWIRIVRKDDLNKLINHLGPDPLKDLTINRFKEILKTSRRPIKLVLMDQEKIAGVGNIYANDALFLSGINPKKRANELSENQTINLYSNLLKVLKDGIKWGGASRNHFRDAFGRKGEVQEHFHVYNREGENCLNRCGEKIRRIKLGGRGTFYCPACQR